MVEFSPKDRESTPEFNKPAKMRLQSRKWRILDFLKWTSGAFGLGGIGIELGTAAGVRAAHDYLNAITSFVRAYGMEGVIIACTAIALLAQAIQYLMQQDVAEGRYSPSQRPGK